MCDSMIGLLTDCSLVPSRVLMPACSKELRAMDEGRNLYSIVGVDFLPFEHVGHRGLAAMGMIGETLTNQ